MKGILLYKSRYGATEKYARWISEETGFDCVGTQGAKASVLQDYDVIILGGGIYASDIADLSFLKKNIEALKEKQIIVFSVGASPYDEDPFQEIVNHNMKDKLSDIPCFYCRGAWDMDKMSFMDRNLCKLLRKAVAKKDPTDYQFWEKALMAAGENSCDWTDKGYIEPILKILGR